MKRFISLIVALSMVLTVGAGVSFAAVGQTGYTDVDGTGYEAPVSILGALNIMGGYTDGSFHPYATITRAEMAAVAVRMHGVTDYGDVVSLDEVQYKDMEGHPLAAAVAYARSMGIVDGYADGYFYPDDPVTYEQAVKMIVGALGYDYYAVARGGYPSGYLNIAKELKLTSGVGLTVGSYITRGDVAKIVFNSLTVDMMKAATYTDKTGDVTYEVVEGKNLLNTYFDVEKLRGVVEENGSTSVSGETSIDKDEVRIGDEIFNVGTTNIGDYLGYYVTFYALETEYNDKRVIVSFKVESSKNEYIKIDAEDIENVELTSSRYIIDYWRNENDKTTRQVKISLTPIVIYNGVALTDFTLSDFNPDYGQLTLVDNDRDGVYDMVDILSYDVMVAISASSASGTVSAYPDFTTGPRSVTLLEDDEDYTVKLVDGEGNPVSFSMITKDSVLFVALSKDEGQTVRTAIVANNKVEGTIRSIDDNGDFVINDQPYGVMDYLAERDALSIGDVGTFYLTYDGRIAGYTAEQKLSREIGLFIGYHSGSMSEGGDMLKIMKSDGSIGIFNLAGSVKLNGVTYSGKELYARISSTTNPLFGRREPESTRMDRVVPEPSKAGILYKVNKKGYITEIVMNDTPDTVVLPTEGTAGANEIRCVVQRGKGSAVQNWNDPPTLGDGTKKSPSNPNDNENVNDSLYYSTVYHCFHRGGKPVYVDDNSVLMWSQEYKDRSDSQSFWVSRPSQMWENDNSAYWFEAYCYYLGDKDYADFIVFYDGVDADNGISKPRFDENCVRDNIKVVDRVIETYTNDDEVVYRLMYWDGGASAYADFHSEFSDLIYRDSRSNLWRRGDMVRFARLEGKIGNIESIFGTSWNDPTGNELTGGKNPNHKYIYPTGSWTLWARYGSECQKYYIGRVTGVKSMRYFSAFDMNYGGGSLKDEPLEGSCYRFTYDGRGYINGVENVGNGSIAADQLVLVRKQGNNNQINLRVKETYILYEGSEIEESATLRSAYSNVYPANEWTGDAVTADAEDAYYSEADENFEVPQVGEAVIPEDETSQYEKYDEI